ncbi:MAG: hypothetical protein H6711_22450 [Myxococcales bacterium]|nr:hypothetical protein [Myxococcales bacterium]
MQKTTRHALRLLPLTALVALAFLPGCDAVDEDNDAESFAEVVERSGTIYGEPDQICLRSSDSSNAGTDDTITLVWMTKGWGWHCDIDGIGRNEEKCCDVWHTGSYDPSWYSVDARFRVWLWDGDGLKVDNLRMINEDGDEQSLTTFDKDGDHLHCNGCNSNGNNCNSCWLDDDDGKNCVWWRADLETQDTTCLMWAEDDGNGGGGVNWVNLMGHPDLY